MTLFCALIVRLPQKMLLISAYLNNSGMEKYAGVHLPMNNPYTFSIYFKVPFVAEWSKAPEFDAETGGESPVQAPVWAVTFSPHV